MTSRWGRVILLVIQVIKTDLDFLSDRVLIKYLKLASNPCTQNQSKKLKREYQFILFLANQDNIHEFLQR